MNEKTTRRLVASLIACAICALAPALASSSQLAPGKARNLPVTPRIKQQLRAVYVANHRYEKAVDLLGPIRGTIRYGTYRAREYALASFSRPLFGTQGQPEMFTRSIGGRWFDRGESGGTVCSNTWPLPLLKVWGLSIYKDVEVNGRTYACLQ